MYIVGLELKDHKIHFIQTEIVMNIIWEDLSEIYKEVSVDIKKHGVKACDNHGFEYFLIEFANVSVRAYLDKDTCEWIGFNIVMHDDQEAESEMQEIVRCYLFEDADLVYLNGLDVQLALEAKLDWILHRLNRSGETKISAELKSQVKHLMRIFHNLRINVEIAFL